MLAMLVECSKEEVEDRMRNITRRSLGLTDWSEEEDCRVYWVHDLLRDHLLARGAAKEKVDAQCRGKLFLFLCVL